MKTAKLIKIDYVKDAVISTYRLSKPVSYYLAMYDPGKKRKRTYYNRHRTSYIFVKRKKDVQVLEAIPSRRGEKIDQPTTEWYWRGNTIDELLGLKGFKRIL